MSKVVIGACFGDEGKGLMVDYLSRSGDFDLVCRYSGGANAGHTVQLEDGTRHVFHHFGAGALAGLPTHLGPRFISQPMLFLGERKRLVDIGCPSGGMLVTVSNLSRVTTYVDMLLNEMAEIQRGDGRHGSCGMGINETVVRSQEYPLRAWDLARVDLEKFLREVTEDWVPRRMDELGIDPAAHPQRMEWIRSERIMDKWIYDVGQFRRCVTVTNDEAALNVNEDYDTSVLFEGSQGLLLDEDHEFFPHVTRTKTGSDYVIELLDSINGIVPVEEVVYVTRPYMTRHGAGPFPTEVDGMGFPDPTNQENVWQGRLRFGALDVGLIREAVVKDVALWSYSPNFRLAMTCCDHVYEQGDEDHIDLRDGLAGQIGLELPYESWGPTYRDVDAI